MPTFSLFYLLLPNHENLWKEKVASILDPKGLYQPPDAATGEAKFPSEEEHDLRVARVGHFWAINRTLQAVYPPYLAASVRAHWYHAGYLDAHGAGIARSPWSYSARSTRGGYEQLLRTFRMA